MSDTQNLPVATAEDAVNYSLFDEESPRSLVNIVPKEVADAIRRVPRELMLEDEYAIRKKANPNHTLNYLRLNFWIEYNRAQEKMCGMNMSVVIKGITHRDYFYGQLLKNPEKLAWVITPPADFEIVQRDILHSALNRLREVCKMSIYTVTEITRIDREGNETTTKQRKPNVSAIAEIRKVVEMLSDRIHGAVVQKLAIKSQTTMIDTAQPKQIADQVHMPGDLEALQKTLIKVDKQLAEMRKAGVKMDDDIYDVAPED